MATRGTVRYRVSADTSQLPVATRRTKSELAKQRRAIRLAQAEWKRAASGVTAYANRVTSLRALGSVALAGGGIFGAAVKQASDFGAKLAENADALGTTVEELQKIQQAFGSDGLSPEAAIKGYSRLSRFIQEAKDGTAEYKEVLDALKLSALDLERLTPTQQFSQIFGALSNPSLSTTDRVSYTRQLLGRDEGFLTLASESGRFDRNLAGIEGLNRVSQEAADALKDLNQEIFNLKEDALKGFFQAVGDNSEAINEFIQRIRGGIPEFLDILFAAARTFEQNMTTIGYGLAAAYGLNLAGRGVSAVGSAVTAARTIRAGTIAARAGVGAVSGAAVGGPVGAGIGTALALGSVALEAGIAAKALYDFNRNLARGNEGAQMFANNLRAATTQERLAAIATPLVARQQAIRDALSLGNLRAPNASGIGTYSLQESALQRLGIESAEEAERILDTIGNRLDLIAQRSGRLIGQAAASAVTASTGAAVSALPVGPAGTVNLATAGRFAIGEAPRVDLSGERERREAERAAERAQANTQRWADSLAYADRIIAQDTENRERQLTAGERFEGGLIASTNALALLSRVAGDGAGKLDTFIKVLATIQQAKSVFDIIKGLLPGFQYGGFAGPGPFIVGEAGPELISSRRQVYVHNNAETMQMLGEGRSASAPTINQTFNFDADISPARQRQLKNTIRATVKNAIRQPRSDTRFAAQGYE